MAYLQPAAGGVRGPGRLGTAGDVSTRCVQSVPLVGLLRACDVEPTPHADENADHNGRVNLIERQRDPQRQRSGHHRARTARLIRGALKAKRQRRAIGERAEAHRG